MEINVSNIYSMINANIELFSIFVICLSVFIISKIALYVFQHKLFSKASKFSIKISDYVTKKLSPVFLRLLLTIAVKLIYKVLKLEVPYLDHFINSVIILAIFDLLIHLYDLSILIWSTKKLLKNHEFITVTQSFGPLFKKIGKFCLFILVVYYILKEWNVDVSPIVGGLGILGLGVSFAAQESIKDLFGGISLTGDKSFKVGDLVEVQDLNIFGEVYDIGLRSTKIKTWDNEVFIIPNGKLSSSVIKNYEYPDVKERVIVPFSVVYGSDIQKVKDVILETIKKSKHYIDYPEPTVLFMEMADFSLKFEARFWVADIRQRFDARLDATTKIYNALNENNISIPFPTSTIYLKKDN